MAKVLDKIENIFFVKLTFKEYQIIDKIGLFNNDENNFDEAVKTKKVKNKLSLLASKL